MLLGGEGGYSGVPRYLELLTEALGEDADITILSDEDRGGYSFVAQRAARVSQGDLGQASTFSQSRGKSATARSAPSSPASAKRPRLQHQTLNGLKTSLSPLRSLRALWGLRAAIRREKPDLIWAHARMAVLLLRLLAIGARVTGRRLAGPRGAKGKAPTLAITLHGLPFGPGHPPLAARLSLWGEWLFLRLMPPHHLHFLSEEAAQSYTAAMGGPKAMARHQLHVLPNCSRLDPGPLGPRPLAPTLVMTGRVGRQKNLMAAAHLLRHLPPEVHLHLCGAGTEAPAFQHQFIEAAGLSPSDAARRLRFLGPLRDIRPVLRGGDVFLLPSRYEGMPIAAIEAFEAGMPLVVSHIPGLAEILAAHPMALAYDPDHPEASTTAIMELLTRYRTVPAQADQAIRQAWRERFSYGVWEGRVRGIVRRMASRGSERRS